MRLCTVCSSAEPKIKVVPGLTFVPEMVPTHEVQPSSKVSVSQKGPEVKTSNFFTFETLKGQKLSKLLETKFLEMPQRYLKP